MYFFLGVFSLKRLKNYVVLFVLLFAFGSVFTGCDKVPFNTPSSESSVLEETTTTIVETTVETTAEATSTPTATSTPIPTPEHILVSFLGDCTLAEALAWNGSSDGFDAVVDGDYQYCFQNASEVLSQDDMTLANFEGTLTDATSHLIKEFVFGSPFEYVQILMNGSIEAVNLANNHSYDYLDEGLRDTQETMEEAGIVWSNQHSYGIYEVRGIKIGMVGLDMVSGGSVSGIYPLIDALKEEGCNIIIASCHWGYERDYSPRNDQVSAGHALIDYGVDIVVGTHPHRLQPIEVYNGKYILYSISNFCFGGNTGLSDPDTAIVQCEFIMNEDNTAVESYRLNVIPYSQTSTRPGNDYCPMPYEWGSADYYRVLERLQWTQEDE